MKKVGLRIYKTAFKNDHRRKKLIMFGPKNEKLNVNYGVIVVRKEFVNRVIKSKKFARPRKYLLYGKKYAKIKLKSASGIINAKRKAERIKRKEFIITKKPLNRSSMQKIFNIMESVKSRERRKIKLLKRGKYKVGTRKQRKLKNQFRRLTKKPARYSGENAKDFDKDVDIAISKLKKMIS